MGLPDYDFVMAYFDGQNNTGLQLAGSNDGYDWTVIPGVEFSPTVGGWNQFRDPSLCRGTNGAFHLVWTTGSDGFGYATSTNLFDWTGEKYVSVERGILSACHMTWAPEICWDAELGEYIVAFSTATRSLDLIGSAWPGDFRGYYVKTTDFTNWTDPEFILTPGGSITNLGLYEIDAALLKTETNYYCFFKIEHNTMEEGIPQQKDGIHYASAPSLAGPWSAISAPRLPGNVANSEGPSPIWIGNAFMVYYDLTPGLRAARSYDLASWEDVSILLNAPADFRHGTVIRLRPDSLPPAEPRGLQVGPE